MKAIKKTLLVCLKDSYPNWIGYSDTDKETSDKVDNLVKRGICVKKISYGNGYKFLSTSLKQQALTNNNK